MYIFTELNCFYMNMVMSEMKFYYYYLLLLSLSSSLRCDRSPHGAMAAPCDVRRASLPERRPQEAPSPAAQPASGGPGGATGQARLQ